MNYDDDGAYINLCYTSRISSVKNLKLAFDEVLSLAHELEEPAQAAEALIGKTLADSAQAVSGWGASSLEKLVDAVESARDSDTKGRSLEELMCRLFELISGFTVNGRVKTATEEIDISIVNGSQNPILLKEGPIVLAECKNWQGKCGKDEFVLFQQKIENRSGRATVGFLVSWNGFASTITKEMLRGSREQVLVVPLDGKTIRRAFAIIVSRKSWRLHGIVPSRFEHRITTRVSTFEHGQHCICAKPSRDWPQAAIPSGSASGRPRKRGPPPAAANATRSRINTKEFWMTCGHNTARVT